MKKLRSYVLVAVVAALLAIQLAPVDRTNPRVQREIRWDSQETADLARRACYDCHSNESTWPWYSYVAPVSWRVAGHVADARSHLNFSTWNLPNEDLDEVREQLEERHMPLWDYKLVHPEARLTDEEYDQLLAGIEATFEIDPPIARRRPGAGADSTASGAAEGAPADSLATGGDAMSDSLAAPAHDPEDGDAESDDPEDDDHQH